MAGLGGKNWSFQEEVTSSDVNGFLADQVVMRFANAAGRDAGFGGAGEPTLAEGMVCYLNDTNEMQVYTGSAWEPVNNSYLVRVATGVIAGSIITAPTDYTVTFPAGRFTAAPIVTASAYGAQRAIITFKNDPMATTTGFTVTVEPIPGVGATITRVAWVAVQAN